MQQPSPPPAESLFSEIFDYTPVGWVVNMLSKKFSSKKPQPQPQPQPQQPQPQPQPQVTPGPTASTGGRAMQRNPRVNSPWIAHVKRVQAEHGIRDYKIALQYASKTWRGTEAGLKPRARAQYPKK